MANPLTLTPFSSTTLNNTIVPVPTLSSSGWVTALHEKADLLLSHLFAADLTQSFLYDGQVTSIQGIVEQYSNDPVKLSGAMQDAVTKYFTRYYSSPIVETTLNDIDPATTNGVNLNIWIQVVENGQTYSLGAILNVVNSKFTVVTNIINRGF